MCFCFTWNLRSDVLTSFWASNLAQNSMLDCFNLDISDSVYHMYSEIINEVKEKQKIDSCLFICSDLWGGAWAQGCQEPAFTILPSVIVWQVHTTSQSWKNFIILALSPGLWASLIILCSYVSFLYFARHCCQSLSTCSNCSLWQCKQMLLYFLVIHKVAFVYFFLPRHLGKL